MKLTFDCTLTDTFGGEANYSWVQRYKLELPEGSTDRQIVCAAKALMGLTGVRCRTEQLGDCWQLYPYKSLTVAFITATY